MSIMRDEFQLYFNSLLQKQLIIGDTLLHEAIRYSVLTGGKRLRPLLVYATGACVKAEQSKLDNAAIAVELIHAYSLIHDDLPAMDNAELRHGQLSCHQKFGEALAILAGDALQSMAIEVLTQNNDMQQINILAHAASTMVIGQHLDMLAEKTVIDLPQLEKIHLYKTGALISASVRLGLLCGVNDPALVAIMTQFAEKLGLAFQIQDDILDATGETLILGKIANSDKKQQKATYVTMVGLAAAENKLQEITQEVYEFLPLIPNAELLAELTHFIISRDH
jgi:farnesyl diphosphate synthase